jgi:hypothetical protein
MGDEERAVTAAHRAAEAAARAFGAEMILGYADALHEAAPETAADLRRVAQRLVPLSADPAMPRGVWEVASDDA